MSVPQRLLCSLDSAASFHCLPTLSDHVSYVNVRTLATMMAVMPAINKAMGLLQHICTLLELPLRHSITRTDFSLRQLHLLGSEIDYCGVPLKLHRPGLAVCSVDTCLLGRIVVTVVLRFCNFVRRLLPGGRTVRQGILRLCRLFSELELKRSSLGMGRMQ